MITTQNLKNAARAIECDLWTDPDGANYLCKDGAILRRWEPSESGDDSLNLAVALRIDIKFLDGFKQVLGYASYARSQENTSALVGYGDGTDRSPTTRNVREAVLLVAAQIGAAL